MSRVQCDGWVHSLQGQTICFTGTVFVDGEWLVRRHCAERALLRGAQWKEDFSRKITVVVHGDLASKVVTDQKREYSKKLVGAAQERSQGHHVCVVDGDGFADLISGHSARCRELLHARSSGQVLVLPEAGDGILGGPLEPNRTGPPSIGPVRSRSTSTSSTKALRHTR